ncbi:MAG: hypothetical protein RSC68_22800, partial [Acinetobacter sp.]
APGAIHGDTSEHSRDIMLSLNSCLEGEMKFNGIDIHGWDGAMVRCIRRDPWGQPYTLRMLLPDLDVDADPETRNSSLRFVVVSSGKNATTPLIKEDGTIDSLCYYITDDVDDIALTVCATDGKVSSCYIGTKENAEADINTIHNFWRWGYNLEGKWAYISIQPGNI